MTISKLFEFLKFKLTLVVNYSNILRMACVVPTDLLTNFHFYFIIFFL